MGQKTVTPTLPYTRTTGRVEALHPVNTARTFKNFCADTQPYAAVAPVVFNDDIVRIPGQLLIRSVSAKRLSDIRATVSRFRF